MVYKKPGGSSMHEILLSVNREHFGFIFSNVNREFLFLAEHLIKTIQHNVGLNGSHGYLQCL